MSTIIVRTQAELDSAIEEHGEDRSKTILIASPAGVRVRVAEPYGSATVRAAVEASGSATVRAYGTATVRAYDSATVRAYGTATVRAYGSATVRAYDSATVRAYESATVLAYDSATVRAYESATVRAYDSATVRASELATVRAYDSATVLAYDSATVRAYGSATVRAYGTATVRAYGAATVRAYGSATVEASTHVAVHLHSARATATGGFIFDLTNLDLTDPPTWTAYTGATVTDGIVTLYKAVDDDLRAGHSWRLTEYPIGQDVTAPDWRDDNGCGGGLHASPHPHQAMVYAGGATRMLEVTVPLTDLRPIPGGVAKAKARTLHVVREVAIDGLGLTESEEA